MLLLYNDHQYNDVNTVNDHTINNDKHHNGHERNNDKDAGNSKHEQH